MIGSPDVVAFTKEDDDCQANLDPWAIPEEFSIPLHPPADSNPWAKTSYAKFTKDFILISEFSEQVGPQPLLTIPEDPKIWGTFDLNYFSLRIMSVDYQASFVGHPPGSGYPRLSFVEDSRVVLGDSKEGAFAYVHHLTLYDLEARGFVRPFCMAYVSADERKIMLQFQELSIRFSKASECLKAGNRRAFAKELHRKLRDLEYTYSVLQREEGLQREAGTHMYSAHAVEKANELANVEKSIYEHRDLLKQISSYPHRPRRDPQAVACQMCMSECEELFAKYAKLSKEGDDVWGSNGHKGEVGMDEDECVKRRPSYTPQLIKAKSAKCFDKRLKTLQELCDNNFYEATLELLKETEKNFRGDLCYLHTRRLHRALRREQRIINFLFEEEICEDDYDDLDSRARLRTFCAMNHAVENLTLITPEPIVGGSEPLKPYDHASETRHTPSLTLEDGDLQFSCFDQDMDIQKPYGNCSNQISSKPVLDQESDSTPDCDYKTDVDGQSNSEWAEAATDEERDPRASSEETTKEELCEDSTLVSLDAACCMAHEQFIDNPPDVAPHITVNMQNTQILVVKREPQALLPLLDDYAVGSLTSESHAAGLLGDALSHTSAEDGSDCTMSTSTGSDWTASPLGNRLILTLRQKKKAGQGALRFVRQYPFAIQALWCLLSGRTLVVLGADEGRVRRLVSALALFVPAPGKCGERVQPWLCCPFTLTDLHRWKLIGLQRVASPVGSSIMYSLSRYSRYISILDSDQKTLRCPPYCGELLTNMADHRTYVRRGSTYFLHVQSILCRLVAKAFLFTFTHHLHLPVNHTEGSNGVETRRNCFLREQLGDDDSQIVLYLSQLINQHYLHGADGCSATAPSFSFNYTTSVLYKI
ncbi:guanine nucleotide exchange protein smcr8a [Stigmatopora nigra]